MVTLPLTDWRKRCRRWLISEFISGLHRLAEGDGMQSGYSQFVKGCTKRSAKSAASRSGKINLDSKWRASHCNVICSALRMVSVSVDVKLSSGSERMPCSGWNE